MTEAPNPHETAFVDPDPLAGPVDGPHAEVFNPQGRTVVKAQYPYAFQSRQNFPLVDHTSGLQVNRDQADSLVEESNGLVYIVNNEEE